MLTEREQEIVSGMIDVMDNLFQGDSPRDVAPYYHRLRAEGMILAGLSTRD